MSLVYSCQSSCARIDLIARKRLPATTRDLNQNRLSSTALPSEKASGKQPVRESAANSTKIDDPEECFIGTIVVTPTAGDTQLTFSISQKTSLLVNSFLAPRISFRLTIPSSSAIFKIAAFGTVSQLQEILQKGTGYWNVCDENGVTPIHVRPLTNEGDYVLTSSKYAARTLNIENCQLLLDLVNDVDTIEPNSIRIEYGHELSMVLHQSECML